MRDLSDFERGTLGDTFHDGDRPIFEWVAEKKKIFGQADFDTVVIPLFEDWVKGDIAEYLPALRRAWKRCRTDTWTVDRAITQASEMKTPHPIARKFPNYRYVAELSRLAYVCELIEKDERGIFWLSRNDATRAIDQSWRVATTLLNMLCLPELHFMEIIEPGSIETGKATTYRLWAG